MQPHFADLRTLVSMGRTILDPCYWDFDKLSLSFGVQGGKVMAPLPITVTAFQRYTVALPMVKNKLEAIPHKSFIF